MKKLNIKLLIYATLTCITISLFSACKTTPDSKAVKKEVLNLHDKLMIDGEKVIKNRMSLDALLLTTDSTTKQKAITDTLERKKISNLISRLNLADEKMMDWMHGFKDDYDGKSEEKDLDYYKAEMIKIRDIEDTYIKVIRESDSVLNINHIKSDPASTGIEKHKH